ncbi:MAG TPA: hypothetical protein VKF62_01875, partial [Planctomycetota bacterium]|nr:hypothetical protein [Planctomycetota bacterium]
MARLASPLRGLARLDGWIAALESALLCLLLLALVAGGVAQVLAQNVGLVSSGGFRLGLLVAGLGLL